MFSYISVHHENSPNLKVNMDRQLSVCTNEKKYTLGNEK